MFHAALDFAAQLLWPARCASCDALVPPSQSFCAGCDSALMAADPACPRCALPLEEGPCDRCRRVPFGFARADAALIYGGAVARALLRFKHGGRADLARPLGRRLAPILERALGGVDAILPVPLHPRRLRTRGFNQALALIHAARGSRRGSDHGWPPVWVDALRRVRDTPEMGHHSPIIRRALVRDAFAVPDPAEVRGARLLVVDDVMTTGATLAGCARALHEAGATSVSVVVLARAVA
jgi:ComF family protein